MQMKLLLLHWCLSCCKIVHILCTVSPHLLSHLSDFDDLLYFILAWHGLFTIPFRISHSNTLLFLRDWEVLLFHRASDMVYAAYLCACLGSCSNVLKDLVCYLFVTLSKRFLVSAQQNLVNLLQSSYSFFLLHKQNFSCILINIFIQKFSSNRLYVIWLVY